MLTTVKTCRKCGVEKPLASYYEHKSTKDRLFPTCKECDSAAAKARYERNRIKHKETQRAYQATERGKATNARKYERNKKAVYEKLAARRTTNNYILNGRLIRKPCEKCGEPKTDAHHDDYSRPLDVKWLCRKHHLEHHGKQSLENV